MTDHIGDVTQMVPMTQQRLEEIRARWEAATPGRRDYDPESCAIVIGSTYLFVEGADAEGADLEFELHALEDCQALLAEVERLRAERDVAVHALEGLMSDAMGDAAALTCPLPVPTCMPVWIGRKE